MSKKVLYWTVAVFLFAASCGQRELPVAPKFEASNPIHDPPGLIGKIRDTLIDYTEEAKALGLIREPGVVYRLHPDNRLAYVGEGVLALTGWDWKITKSINGNAVSDFNYLASDLNAYNVVKKWLGSCNPSNWKGPHTGDPDCATRLTGNNCFYHYPQNYGFAGDLGHSGYCVFFANTLGFRSGNFPKAIPTYANTYADFMNANGTPGPRRYTKTYDKARVGDIMRSKKTNGHTTGPVVKIMAGIEGQSVTSVDVIDGNYVGGNGQEIIGRHVISISGTGSGLGDLDNYYAIDLDALIAYLNQ